MKTLVPYFLLLSGLAIAIPVHALSDETAPLTVETAVRLVLQNNSSLQEAEDAIAIFKAREGQSRSGLFPNVRGDFSYTRLDPISALEIPGLGNFDFSPHNNYDINVGVRQVLYDFNRTREGIRLARSQVTSAEDRWELMKRDLGFRTAQSFYTILLLRENIRVKEAHIGTLDEHLEITKRKLLAGTATDLDVLNTQVRVAAAQNQKLSLENAREKELIALGRLMGRQEKSAPEPSGELSYEPEALDADELFARAKQNRLEVRIVQNVISSASIQQRLAGLQDKPSLNLNLIVGTKNGYVPNLNRLKLNLILAVQADIPIFDGHRTSSLKAEAQANLRTLEDRQRDVEAMIQAEVLQAVSDVRTSEKELQLVEVNVEQARKAQEFSRARYEAGTVTNLDLIDAEEAYAEAKLMRYQALYRCIVSRLALQRATGNSLI